VFSSDENVTGPEWLLFEREVARFLADLDPGSSVQHNARLPGLLSKTIRQVDALIEGTIAGRRIVLVAECKRYTSAVGIGLIDEFVGKLLDVGVSVGLMYAFTGYTKEAESRATGSRNPEIELRQLPEDQGHDYSSLLYRLKYGDCPNPNCILGDIGWSQSLVEDGDGVEAGSCDSCGALAARCPECGDVTAVDSGEQECDSCEVVFEVLRDRKGEFEGVIRAR